MKSNFVKCRILSFALLVITWPPGDLVGQAPYYDFDSLLQSNSQFNSFASMVFDTFQIFGPEEPLEFTVSTDFRALSKNKLNDEYQEAQVIYQLWDTINISREIRIKPRGVLRLKICSQPPLRVNVKKTKNVFQLLDDLDKIKLVVPCRGVSAYQNYIYSEYLAYKLYNVITNNSFRVRMIRVMYHDTGGKVKTGNAYTFIIESHESLAERQRSIPIKNDKLSGKYIDQQNAANFYLFQYMIGNTDWSVHGLHNIKLLKTEDVTRPYPIAVPYDFDYAGLVNASYAIPGDHVDIKAVTDRVYLGFCLPEETMDKTIEHFIQRESEVLTTVRDFDLMSDDLKKKTLKYLQEFYDIIKEPKRRTNRIIKKCKSYG